MEFDRKIIVPDHVLFRELEGESVLLNIETETYFGLNDVATRIWHAISEAGSLQSAFDALLAEFDVEPQRLRSDMAELLDRLEQNRLIEIIDES